jgi:hypothetical protein
MNSERAKEFLECIGNGKTIYQLEEEDELVDDFCGDERPPRRVFCQLKKGHKGSHRAVLFWEGEK